MKNTGMSLEQKHLLDGIQKVKKINEHLGYWGNGNLKFKYFFNQKG